MGADCLSANTSHTKGTYCSIEKYIPHNIIYEYLLAKNKHLSTVGKFIAVEYNYQYIIRISIENQSWRKKSELDDCLLSRDGYFSNSIFIPDAPGTSLCVFLISRYLIGNGCDFCTAVGANT